MKKIFSVLFFLALALVCFVPKTTVFAEENETLEVITNSCVVYQIENGKTFETISSLNELIKLEELKFGEKVSKLEETNFEYTNKNGEKLLFVKVKTSSETVGYVLANCVSLKQKSLNTKLDPNAKIASEKAFVYISNEEGSEKLTINGTEVALDKGKEFCEILFEHNNEIKTGFVKTIDVAVEGFNSTIILIVFIFILIASIIWAIYSATKKKRKKQQSKK